MEEEKHPGSDQSEDNYNEINRNMNQADAQ